MTSEFGVNPAGFLLQNSFLVFAKGGVWFSSALQCGCRSLLHLTLRRSTWDRCICHFPSPVLVSVICDVGFSQRVSFLWSFFCFVVFDTHQYLQLPITPSSFTAKCGLFLFKMGIRVLGQKWNSISFLLFYVFIFIFIFSPIVISSVDFFICWVHVVSFLLKSFDFQVYFLTRVIKTCKCWIQFIELVLLRLPFCSSDQRETVFFFFFSFSIHLITLQCKYVFFFLS